MIRPVLGAIAVAALAWAQTAPAQEAGERFRDCPECPEMAGNGRGAWRQLHHGLTGMGGRAPQT